MSRFLVHIVGHTTGPFGEVTNAAKLRAALVENGHHAVVHDISDLGVKWDVVEKKAGEARARASRGYAVVDPEYKRDPRFIELGNRVSMFSKPGHVQVLYFLTWPENLRAFIRMGFHKIAPVITRYYPAAITETPHDSTYVKMGDVTAVISPLGALKALREGVPAHKIVFVPHTYPRAANLDEISERSAGEKRAFISEVAASMGKRVNVPRDPVIFTCLKAFESRNNIVELIRTFREVARRNPNAFLLLKDEGWRDIAQKGEFQRLVQEVEHEPWFLWEKKREPLSVIAAKHLPLTDVSIVLSGLEAASTSLIEAAAFGKPLVTLDATTHPYLFKGGASFVRSVVTGKKDRFGTQVPVPDRDHLMSVLERFATDPLYRKEWGKRAAQMARERFSPQRSLGRFLLASQAAYVYRNGSRDKINEMKKRVEAALHEDLRLFQVER